MTETTTKTTPTADGNGATAPAAQPKTTAPRRTASRATRAAAKSQPAAKPASTAKATTAKAAPKTQSKANANGSQPKAAANGSQRNGKRDLATRVVLAVAEMVKGLTADELKALGMTRPEAAVCASTWIHHLPADREQWVRVLPKPDRSDWR